jgi:hypothetical protein
MIYIVNYQEGSRGSFISDLLGLLLNDDATAILEIDPIYGTAGRVFLDITEIANEEYPNNYLKLQFDNNFGLVSGVPLDLIGFEKFTNVYPDWEALYIVYEPEEKLTVDVLNIYKNFYKDEPIIANYYWAFYLKNKNILSREIANLKELDSQELKKFIELYWETDNGINKFNKKFSADYWDSFVSSIPEQYQNRIHRINFSDITNNKEKILNILSEITGKTITANVVASYDRYLQYQNLPKKLMDITCTT